MAAKIKFLGCYCNSFLSFSSTTKFRSVTYFSDVSTRHHNNDNRPSHPVMIFMSYTHDMEHNGLFTDALSNSKYMYTYIMPCSESQASSNQFGHFRVF